MIDPVTMFREGGSFMYAILLGGLCMPLFILAAGVLAGLRVRVPAALHYVTGTSVLMVGAFGTLMGLNLVDHALAHCSAEMYAKLAANGLSVSLYTLVGGALVTAPTLMAMAGAMALGSAVDVKKRRLSILHAGAAFPLVGAAFAYLFAGSILGLVLALVALTALAIVALFASTDDEENARLASVRGTVGGLVTLSFVSMGLTHIALAAIPYYQARANASADMQATLIARASEDFVLSGGASVVAVATGLLASALLIAPLFKGVLTPRVAIGSIAAGLALVPGLLLLVYTGVRIGQTHPETISAAETRQAALDDLDIDLLGIQTDAIRRSVLARPTLTFLNDGTVLLDGEPRAPGPLPMDVADQGVNVEVSAQTPLSTLLEHEIGGAREVDFVVRSHDGLRTLKLRPEGPDTDGFVEIIRSGIVVVVDGENARVAIAREGELAAASEVVFGAAMNTIGHIRDRFPDDEVYLWLPADRTAGDLFYFIESVIMRDENSGRQPAFVHWRIDPPPALALADEQDEDSTGEPSAADAANTRVTAKTGLGEVTSTGSLDPSIIKRTVRRYSGQARYCYDKELAKDPSLAGRLEVKMVIGADGTISAASIESNTTENADLASCIVAKVERWTFPQPEGGGIVIVKYPFVFGTR